MRLVAVVARYRYCDRVGDTEGRSATFYGRFYERSEPAVLGRLREVHRFAAWIWSGRMHGRRGQDAGIEAPEALPFRSTRAPKAAR